MHCCIDLCTLNRGSLIIEASKCTVILRKELPTFVRPVLAKLAVVDHFLAFDLALGRVVGADEWARQVRHLVATAAQADWQS